MSNGKKILLGLFSLLPITLLIIYFARFFTFFIEMIQRSYYYEADPTEFFRTFMPLFILIMVKILITIALLIIYLIHLINNKKIDSTERIIWILAFIFVGFVSFPLYWYMRIWKTESLAQAS